MKKKILIGVLGVAATVVAHGQGQIIFSNYYASGGITHPYQDWGVTYGNGPDAGLGVGPEISAILLFGASTDTQISQLSPVAGSTTAFGLGVATGPGSIGVNGAGLFSAGKVTVNGGTAGTYAFAIEAIGTLNGVQYIGYSPIGVGPTSTTSSSPIPLLPLATIQPPGFTVEAVPEPSILALSGIGAAALMLVRRRVASNPAMAGEDGKK